MIAALCFRGYDRGSSATAARAYSRCGPSGIIRRPEGWGRGRADSVSQGKFVRRRSGTIAIYDLGVVMGASVTDFLRTFRQRPYRMEAHVSRFHASMRHSRIESPLTPR